MDGDWKRLGQLLISRRAGLGYPRRAAFLRWREATSFDRIASDLEAGNRSNYEPGTLAQAEHIYGWDTGSIAAVLSGGQPAPVPLTDAEAASPAREYVRRGPTPERMLRQAQEALEQAQEAVEAALEQIARDEAGGA